MTGNDMSEKEYNDRKIKEAWKKMSLLQKVDYIWTYYKAYMAAVVLFAAAVWLGVTIYRGMTTEVLLNVVVVGAASQDTEELKQEFTEYAGLEDSDGILRIRTGISADTENSNSTTALSTLLGANAVDVLICPQEVYEKYTGQGGFTRAITLEEGNPLEKLGLAEYEPAYAAIVVTGENQDLAETFLQFLVNNAN